MTLNMNGPCHRCNGVTNVTTLSFFNEEVICMVCKVDEKYIKNSMSRQKLNMVEYEGCGRVPWEFTEIPVK